MTDKQTLYAAVNAVKAEVNRISKTGKNQHFGYMFATESDIADTLRPLMAKHGVCLCYLGPDPSLTKMESAGTTKSGAPKNRYLVWAKYRVVSAIDPSQSYEVWGLGEAIDQEDKGFNKAITAAHKYVLIKLFDVSTGDLAIDPDSSSHLHEGPAQRAAPAKPAPSKRAELLARVKEWSKVMPEDVPGAVMNIAAKLSISKDAKGKLSDADIEKISQWVNDNSSKPFTEAIK